VSISSALCTAIPIDTQHDQQPWMRPKRVQRSSHFTVGNPWAQDIDDLLLGFQHTLRSNIHLCACAAHRISQA
jgi:hypothetical protein